MNDNQFLQNQEGMDTKAAYMPGVMTGVFLWMLIGLGVSAVAAWFVVDQPVMMISLLNSVPGGFEVGFYGLIILELALVFVLSAALRKLPSVVATVMFLVYALVNGLTLSFVLLAYDLGSVMIALACTAGMFGFMAGYGLLTKADLSGYRSFLMMGLFGIIIVSIVNIFLKSSGLEWIVCLASIFIFVGLTAYDTQKIKRLLGENPDGETAKKIKVYGALMLYLDFINIFLNLLRLLGRKR